VEKIVLASLPVASFRGSRNPRDFTDALVVQIRNEQVAHVIHRDAKRSENFILLFPQGIDASAKSLIYKSNMAPADAIKEIRYTHQQEGIAITNSANLFGTDNFILIRLRTPRIFNDTTGATDPFTEVDTFSGIYKVTRITSKFEMGKFTQDLECLLDPVIDLRDLKSFKEFFAAIETANSRPDPTVASMAITDNPPNAIRENTRLTSTTNIPKGTSTGTPLVPSIGTAL
jgi:hypothetical protein